MPQQEQLQKRKSVNQQLTNFTLQMVIQRVDDLKLLLHRRDDDIRDLQDSHLLLKRRVKNLESDLLILKKVEG